MLHRLTPSTQLSLSAGFQFINRCRSVLVSDLEVLGLRSRQEVSQPAMVPMCDAASSGLNGTALLADVRGGVVGGGGLRGISH